MLQPKRGVRTLPLRLTNRNGNVLTPVAYTIAQPLTLVQTPSERTRTRGTRPNAWYGGRASEAPVLLLATAFSFAAAPPPVVNGETTQDYPEVVLLYMTDSRQSMAASCTGSLIAPNWVLTASHCVTDSPDFEIAYVYVAFLNNSNEYSRTNTFEATAWYANPKYSSRSGLNDIALIELDERDAQEGPFMPLVAEGPKLRDKGALMRIVGFGATDDNDNSAIQRKRFADVPLEDYDDTLLFTLDTETDKNACHGDSGGPVLHLYEDGTYAVAGIVDYGTQTCMSGGLYSARVDAFTDFIDGYTTDYTVWAEAVEEVEDTGNGDASPVDDGADAEPLNSSESPGLCGTAAGSMNAGLAVAALAALTTRRRS